jgi:hypothetical protein
MTQKCVVTLRDSPFGDTLNDATIAVTKRNGNCNPQQAVKLDWDFCGNFKSVPNGHNHLQWAVLLYLT